MDEGGTRGALVNAKRLNNPSCHIADPLLKARMLRNRVRWLFSVGVPALTLS